MEAILGIDTSRWQWGKPIPWVDLKQMGVAFSIEKATHGLSQDAFFKRGFQEARSLSLLRGAYHWFVPTIDAVRQAENFVHTVVDAGFDELDLVAIDFEEPCDLRGAPLVDALMRCVDVVEEALDKPAVIYTGNWYYSQYALDVDDERLATRRMWHSQYPKISYRSDPKSLQAYEEAKNFAVSFRTTVASPWRSRGIAETFFQFDGDRGLLLPNGVDADFNIFRGSTEDLEREFLRTMSSKPVVPTLLANKPAESVVLSEFLGSLADDTLANLATKISAHASALLSAA